MDEGCVASSRQIGDAAQPQDFSVLLRRQRPYPPFWRVQPKGREVTKDGRADDDLSAQGVSTVVRANVTPDTVQGRGAVAFRQRRESVFHVPFSLKVGLS